MSNSGPAIDTLDGTYLNKFPVCVDSRQRSRMHVKGLPEDCLCGGIEPSSVLNVEIARKRLVLTEWS